MCTASWILEPTGYHVFFNRDEQKGRATALPPQRFAAQDDTAFLMPIDPVGNGSWIATNEFGLTLCLLNFYQGETPKGELISRGQLVKSFAHYDSAEKLISDFEKLSYQEYAPFTLVVFDAQLTAFQGHVRALQWDGKTLVDSLALPPLISSAVDAENVRHARRQLFAACNQKEESLNARLAFHHSHDPEKGHFSPCMHRDDAHTVSFTHIAVTNQSVEINYQEGSPCLGRPYQNLSLEKRAQEMFG